MTAHVQRANEQLRQLTDLQDEMLARCADRGEYWEQCFYNGMRNDKQKIDFQWGSPEAALEIPQKATMAQGLVSAKNDNAGKKGNNKNKGGKKSAGGSKKKGGKKQ